MKHREELYPEEQMMIEKKAIDVFLDVAEYGNDGIDYFRESFEKLVTRQTDYDNGK